jgi:hypothetical protein
MLALVYKFLGALSVVAYLVESLETKYSDLRPFRLFNSEQRECGITNLFRLHSVNALFIFLKCTRGRVEVIFSSTAMFNLMASTATF